MDCSKGFDKVNHSALFLKLMKRNVPLCYMRIIVYWYSNMMSNCRWMDSYSEYFPIPSGVRQGGILSPYLWAVYVDDLIIKLRESGYGCYIASIFVACVLYADDVALMSPTVHGMQCLIDICSSYANENALRYNFKKTKVMFFGKSTRPINKDSFRLNGGTVEIVDSWKYLGFHLRSMNGMLVFDPSEERKSFYRASNSVINAVYKPSEEVLMKLFFTNCVSILSYGLEVKEYLTRDKRSIHVAMNDGIRKIFGWNRWESIRELGNSFGFDDIYVMAAKSKCLFGRLFIG